MSEKQEEQDKPEKKGKVPPRRANPELSEKVIYDMSAMWQQNREISLTIELDEQEQPQPEKPVPPRQDDPLLGDYVEKGQKPSKETKQK